MATLHETSTGSKHCYDLKEKLKFLLEETLFQTTLKSKSNEGDKSNGGRQLGVLGWTLLSALNNTTKTYLVRIRQL